MFVKNLILFAHNLPRASSSCDWNNGMLESWNDGFKETRIQKAYYFIDFLILMESFSGKNQN